MAYNATTFRGAGTEIIRAHHLEELDSTAKPLIYGVRHHIYTILSIVCHCNSVATAGNYIECYLTGYDAREATAQQPLKLFMNDMQVDQTFVWNDKVSFNGYEPVDYSGVLDSEAKQDAIADQLVSGDSNRQILYIKTEAGDNMDVWCTFIDQNNS